MDGNLIRGGSSPFAARCRVAAGRRELELRAENVSLGECASLGDRIFERPPRSFCCRCRCACGSLARTADQYVDR
ncbi:hypothetical protein WS62_09635 [Burkholderia sp. ABCPW 14]|nr:hypothetical protein WS62_09635 [Burkholderia sp. ABCPW 14]